MNELVEEILKMASKGVWHQDIFSGFDRAYRVMDVAVKIARKKGMYPVADMRDEKKGTYYQFDEKENNDND